MLKRGALLVMTGFVIASVAIVAGAFLGSRATSEPSEEPETTAVALPPQRNGGPPGDLAYHNAYISFSDDPASFDSGSLIAEEASVPDALVCAVDSEACDAGDILVYFVDVQSMTTFGTEHIGVIRSADGGKTWSDRTVVAFEDKPTGFGVVDPSVVQLEDGRIRLYYFGPTMALGGGDPASQEGPHLVYSAISVDGITFSQEEGVRLSYDGSMTDPEVIRFDGRWHMYYSVGAESGVAVSDDGLAFEDLGLLDANAGGVPGAIALGGGVRIYGCRLQGIQSAFAEDGLAFGNAATTLASKGTCDPSPAAYGDGYLLVYKQIDRP